MKKSARQGGQALVLVLLSLAVVLTLVLYILSRSVTDIAVTSREEESVRAFSAAEAGIEQALVIGSGSGGPITIGDASYSSTVTGVAQGSREFNYPIDLGAGDTATLWFVSHDADGNLICNPQFPCYVGNSFKVCWGKQGTPLSGTTTPAVEVSIFYNDNGIKIQRGAFDPFSGPLGGRSNGFSAPDSSNGSCAISGVTYQFAKTITFDKGNPVEGDLIFAKVRMFYNTDRNHGVGFRVSGGTLPSQGLLINSTGTSGDGGSNRRLEVFQSWPEPPAIFDFAVFSSGALTK